MTRRTDRALGLRDYIVSEDGHSKPVIVFSLDPSIWSDAGISVLGTGTGDVEILDQELYANRGDYVPDRVGNLVRAFFEKVDRWKDSPFKCLIGFERFDREKLNGKRHPIRVLLWQIVEHADARGIPVVELSAQETSQVLTGYRNANKEERARAVNETLNYEVQMDRGRHVPDAHAQGLAVMAYGAYIVPQSGQLGLEFGVLELYSVGDGLAGRSQKTLRLSNPERQKALAPQPKMLHG